MSNTQNGNIQSDPVGLVQEIRKVLGADQEIREQAETNIVNIANNSPDSFVYSLMDLLADQSGNYSLSDKKSACMWLQKALSTFLKGLPDLYFKISPETRQTFRTRIFEILVNEQDGKVKKAIADSIGEIAGSLISDENCANELPNGEAAWPNFVSLQIQNIPDKL